MPPSVQRHNLARLRNALSLTQSEFAQLIGRKEITVRSIETGKLALSPRLATLIADVTGADRDWLLSRNLKAPIPPLKRISYTLRPEDFVYDATIQLLAELFSRLCAVMRRLRKIPGSPRFYVEELLKPELDALAQSSEPDPQADLLHKASIHTIEFFISHPEKLDPDLRKLINFDFLLKDSLNRECDDQKIASPSRLRKKSGLPALRKSRSPVRSKP
jgi:transcriptional regulator with XRE-family HTH domain